MDINISLSPDLKAKIEHEADARGMSLSDFVRESLEWVIAQKPAEDPCFRIVPCIVMMVLLILRQTTMNTCTETRRDLHRHRRSSWLVTSNAINFISGLRNIGKYCKTTDVDASPVISCWTKRSRFGPEDQRIDSLQNALEISLIPNRCSFCALTKLMNWALWNCSKNTATKASASRIVSHLC